MLLPYIAIVSRLLVALTALPQSQNNLQSQATCPNPTTADQSIIEKDCIDATNIFLELLPDDFTLIKKNGTDARPGTWFVPSGFWSGGTGTCVLILEVPDSSEQKVSRKVLGDAMTTVVANCTRETGLEGGYLFPKEYRNKVKITVVSTDVAFTQAEYASHSFFPQPGEPTPAELNLNPLGLNATLDVYSPSDVKERNSTKVPG
ncbi:uncharacterized protein KY384_001736 [Bacidia gigantensis]|uniref:uncharacterized protein n=1 Tax=Bacidia gigantensis TaxID=2732470 RepID=UPI001D048871|nr:uncharacterized protein KY384_001736 [Bacidia gigantensis]KAG8532955.1 hypothetical protein KY384_001736 [Bacidia gigantensis]